MNAEKAVCWVIGIIAATAIGLVVIPPLIKKYGNKLYKSSLKNDEIDIENMGPEIVRKEKAKEE